MGAAPTLLVSALSSRTLLSLSATTSTNQGPETSMGTANVRVTSYVADVASPPECVIVPRKRAARFNTMSVERYTTSSHSPDASPLPTFLTRQVTLIVSADTAVAGAVTLRTGRAGCTQASGAWAALLSSRDCSKV